MKLWLNEVYAQKDPRWANKLLGYNTDPKYTLSSYGCLVATLATYLTAIGKKTTPEELNDKLKDVGGFVPGTGLYIWESVSKVHGDVDLFFTSPRYEEAVPKEALNSMKDMIRNGFFVIIEVDFDPATSGEQTHFVGGVGLEDNGEVVVADPWTGKLIPLSTYGDPAKAIYSFKAYKPTLSEELPLEEPYEQWKIIAWRFGRVFLAGAIGAVTITALNTAFTMEFAQAVKYLAIAIIAGGVSALSKFLRDKYGEDMSNLINKLPV